MVLLLKLMGPEVPNQRVLFLGPEIVIIVLFTIEFIEGFAMSQSSFSQTRVTQDYLHIIVLSSVL